MTVPSLGKPKYKQSMQKLFMYISFGCCVIGLIASIWMSTVLKDTASYAIAGFFLLASIFMGITLWKMKK